MRRARVGRYRSLTLGGDPLTGDSRGGERTVPLQQRGTTFWIFAQSRRLGFTPERIRVDAAGGPIGEGPSDAAVEVIDALDKTGYFNEATGKPRKRPLPPYPKNGRRSSSRAIPRHGAFTHLKPGQRAFSAAMVYAVVRTTLAVWHHFFQLDQPLEWHFTRPERPVLQIHPRVDSRNAWSGDGCPGSESGGRTKTTSPAPPSTRRP